MSTDTDREPGTMTVQEFVDSLPSTPILRVTRAKQVTSPDGWVHDEHRYTLTYEGRDFRGRFRKGLGHHGAPPTLDEVLQAYIVDCRDLDGTSRSDYADWAETYGMDPADRATERTWLTCHDELRAIRALFGHDAVTILLTAVEVD